MNRRTDSWMQQWGWVLVASFPWALLYHNLFELPMALMALSGLWLLCTQPGWVKQNSFPVLLASLCITLPMLLAVPDAVNVHRSLMNSLTSLRYPLAAIFVLYALRGEQPRRYFSYTLGFWMLISSVDMVVQYYQGVDVLGHLKEGARASGLRGDLKMGILMASFGSFFCYLVWQLAQRWVWCYTALGLYVMAVLASGTRSAWLMMVLSLVALAAYVLVRQFSWRKVLVTLLVLALPVGILMQRPEWQVRWSETAGLFSTDYNRVNIATSVRLPIWKVAMHMAQDHWFNGIGTRGFRYLYRQYAEPGDVYIPKPDDLGPTHPHQILLEIITETGMIGLAGYLVLLGYWLRRGIRAFRQQHVSTYAGSVGVLVMLFPLNAGMAFYGSFLSALIWWVMMLALALSEPEVSA